MRHMVQDNASHLARFVRLGLAASVTAMLIQAPALAQTTASVTAADESPAAEPVEPQVDPAALHDEAMQAEWDGRYNDARDLHAQAAQAGHPRSHYQLGFLLLDGLGGPRDVEGARYHLRTAADLGITLALVPYLYAYDTQDDPDLPPDAAIAAHALLELSLRDLGMAGDTIQFWSQPLRRQIQVYLKDAGYYRGAIDGLIGQGSLNALRRFARQRAPLPELPTQPFMVITVSQDGVTRDGRPTFAWDAIDEPIDARSAFAGAWVDLLPTGGWRIGVENASLLDVNTGSGSPTGVPAMYLPTAEVSPPPRRSLRFGMTPAALARGDLGSCALTPLSGPGAYTKRCETRVAGLHVVFEGERTAGSSMEQEAFDRAPRPVERLVSIELSPPPQLRLSQAEDEQ